MAIIGVLASVVLASLNSAKKKGDDTVVKSNLRTVANQAGLFYSDNDSYLPAGGSTFSIAACPVYNAAGTNMLSKNKVVADSIAEAIYRGNGSSCYNSANIWTVAVGLKLTANTSWCVDVSGAARVVNSAPASAINSSTFLCN